MSEAKPFSISKQEVWEAYQKVKANHGAAGVDGQSIAEFVEQAVEWRRGKVRKRENESSSCHAERSRSISQC